MAIEEPGPIPKPEGSGSDFDAFRASRGRPQQEVDVEEYAELAKGLRRAVRGDVRFDEYTQLLYATDGSIYQARPAGVVHPRDAEDVRAAVRVTSSHGVPVIGRGAGSSLAGQAVGPGCVVFDFSTYMDGIVEVRPEERRARVQPGVVQDHFDEYAARWGLKFAPDPASSNRATIGGGIGNNSTGAHSVRYGITDAYVESLEVVLADGSKISTREIVLDGDEWKDLMERDDREAELHRVVRSIVEDNDGEIESRYPDLKRRVSGYNLDRVIYENRNGKRVINLSKLIVGSESTLGLVVEAEISLVSVPERRALAVFCYDDVIEALAAVPAALTLEPSAVELMDSEVFRLARESEQYARYEEPIPDGTAAALMVEFDDELHDDFDAAIGEAIDRLVEQGSAFEVIQARDEGDQHDLWKLRKAAIPLLMSLEGDPKPYPFIEDATVPPAELAEYVREFQEVLDRHDTSAAYFAHAGSGTLHIRPILDLKRADGVETMRSISEEVTDLVLERHGSFSGEHGDGLARTQFNPKMYGEDIWEAFRAVKEAFDPNWLLNPGKVVYREDEPTDMREHLRYGPAYQSIEPTTTLDFEPEGGFTHLVELCNGCGTCRQTEDVMCPTYRGMKDEIATTRGRANLLRAALSGDLPPDELYSSRFQEEVLDLCVGCKGCKSDCPTGVDLAKLKAEVKHGYHRRTGADRRTRLFADVDRLSALGASFAPISNWLANVPGARRVLERTLGISRERTLPSFTRTTFESWAAGRLGDRPTSTGSGEKVLLLPDTYTNYVNPTPGRAAVEVLEAVGVEVAVAGELGPSGRAAYSVGMLDVARDRAAHNVEVMSTLVDEGWDLLAVEPSDVEMFRDEYHALLPGDATSTVADHVFGVLEYLNDRELLEDHRPPTVPTTSLALHGHCHQKAAGRVGHTARALSSVGYEVDVLDTGCCGMAGSFGYEAEHYDLSMAIGEILLSKVQESDAEVVVAPGASCRAQLRDLGPPTPDVAHPIEMLADVIL